MSARCRREAVAFGARQEVSVGKLDAFKTALDAVRVMQDMATAAHNVELNKTVADAYGAVASAYAEAIELREENLSLKRELESAKDRRALREHIKRDRDVYYFDTLTAGYHVGPFCAQCFDDNEKLITLRFSHEKERGSLQWYCGVCNKTSDSSNARTTK